MTSLFKTLLLLLSSIILSRTVIIPVIYGNYMFDFRPSGFNFTAVMANRWNISRDLTGQTKTSICDSNLIFGGIGVLRGGDTISRTYDSLPLHGMVTFSIFFFFMGDWQTIDTMSLEVDSNPAFQFSPKEVLTKTGAISATDCSGLRFITFTYITGRIQHSGSTITFKISSTTNTQAYYGLKDVVALFTPYSSSGPTGIYLMTKNENSGIAGALYCPAWKYKDSNNVCQSCHSNCNKCFGPGENECYACGLGATYDVTLGRCVPCTTGCMHCSGPQPNECLVCLHQQGYVLDYDGTCKTNCTSPYVEDSAGNSEGRFCRQPCSDPSHFRLIDGTCVSSCPTPLVQRISGDGKGKFCDSPCGQSSIDYYYWNTSCKSICPFFSRTENGGYNYCDTCPIGQFMHANNSCEATCSSLFNVKTVEGYKFCDFKCGRFSTDYYYTVNASCHSTCSFYSRIKDDFKFCYACPTGKFLHSNYSCESSCHSSFNVIDIQGYKFCEFPCGRDSTDFYHWDGTCSSTCSYYSRTTDGYKFCDACSPGFFMHPNSSCETSCNYPYKNRTQKGSIFCDYPCQTNEYFYWNHTCKSSCNSPNVKHTLYFDYCKTPCQQSDEYMFKNNSCSAICPTPLGAVTEVDAKFCDFPCGRLSNDYYYWNTSCNSICTFYSRTTDGFHFCDACSPELFMHPNMSCETSCNYPYKNRTQGGSLLCDYPCQTNEYFYWNHTCKSNCDSPNVKQTLYFDYCKTPCQQSNEYMFKNNSCSATCPAPLVAVTEVDAKFCDFPSGRFSNDYYYWNTSCKITCPFYSRNTDGYNFCDACPLGSGLFMHPNTSCLVHCTFPYKSRTQGGSLLCDYPCQTGEYFYWDYTCRPSCGSPLVKRTLYFDYCETPCQQSDNYMLWDDSCSNSCLEPLVIRTENKVKFCDSPCGRSSTNFLYWNGSCIATCPYYQRNANGYIFCDACQPGYFMYPNTTCLSRCSFPYILKKQSGSQFCLYPCEKAKGEFYYPVQRQCLSSCTYPYQIQEEIFCVLIIPKEKSSVLQIIAEFLSGSNTITSSVGKSIGLVNFQNPDVIFSQLFSRMLDYIKYTSIKFSPELQYVYDVDLDPLFRIIPLLPKEIKEKFPVKSPPDNFKKFSLHSSFFVNFWESFLTLACIIISIFLFVIMGLLTKSCSSVQSLCNYIKNSLKWNFFMMMFISYFGDIVLFSSLEFRTICFDSVVSILSLVLGILTNILVFLVFIKMITVIIARRALKKQMNSNSRAHLAKKKSLLKRLAGFEVMFEGSRDSTVMQQAFMFLFIGRYFLFAGVIAYLYQYPLVQISIICFMSASMLIYLLFVRPMKTIVDFLQYLLEEVTMLVCKICLLILSVYDELQYEENDAREILGEVIKIAMLVSNGLSALYILIQLLGTVKRVYQTIVIWNAKSKEIENGQSEASEIERQNISYKLPIKLQPIRREWRAQEKILKMPNVKNTNFLEKKGEREESVQASHHLDGKKIRKKALKTLSLKKSQGVTYNGNTKLKTI